MENTLQQFLEGIGEKAPDELARVELMKLIFSEESNILEMIVRSKTLVPYSVVSGFQREMRGKWGINDLILRLKYTPDMLTADYFFELTGFLKERFPVVNGFFDDAEREELPLTFVQADWTEIKRFFLAEQRKLFDEEEARMRKKMT